MAGRDGAPILTIEDIAASRNQALIRQGALLRGAGGADRASSDDPASAERVAAALDQAHRDAVAIKQAADICGEGESATTTARQNNPQSPEGDGTTTLADKAEMAAAAARARGDNPAASVAADNTSSSEPRDFSSAEGGWGETVAGAVATADQAATTAVKDAVSGAAGAVKSLMDGIKSLSLSGWGAEGPGAAGDIAAPGVADVEIAAGDGREPSQQHVSAADLETEEPHRGPVARPDDALVDAVERARVEKERREAHDAYLHSKKKIAEDDEARREEGQEGGGGAAAGGVNKGSGDGTVAESPAGAVDQGAPNPQHPTRDSLVQAATATGSPLIHTPTAREGGANGGRQTGWLISSPTAGEDGDQGGTSSPSSPPSAPHGIDLSREPPSLSSATTTPYGVGDPSAQAGGVATGMRAGHAIMTTLKEAVGLGGPPSPPAGPTAFDDVGVGDFATINRRVDKSRKEAVRAAAAPASPSDGKDESSPAGPAAMMSAATALGHLGAQTTPDTGAGTGAGGGSGGAGGTTGGVGPLNLLGGLMADIATKVNISSSSEELLAADGANAGANAGAATDEGGKGTAAAAASMTAGAAGTAKGDEKGPAASSEDARGETGSAPGGGGGGFMGGGILGGLFGTSSAATTHKEGDAFLKTAGKAGQEGGDGVGSTLLRGWEELKRGGAKAPWVETQGETAAPQDITSNVERSRHLDDPGEKRVYDAETYRTAPGSLAADDQAATDQAKRDRGVTPSGQEGDDVMPKSEAVAGDKSQHTGVVPQARPEGPTAKPQSDRFTGGGHIYSSIGTGSAAPFLGDDSVKRAQAAFATAAEGPKDGGGGIAAAALAVPAAAGDGPTCSAEELASGDDVMGGRPASSSLWSLAANVGVGRAKDPSGKEMKDEQVMQNLASSRDTRSPQQMEERIQVLNPLIKDSMDDSHAREMARSYHQCKEEHSPHDNDEDDDTKQQKDGGGSDDAPVAMTPPSLRLYDPIGHMKERKEADASKLAASPGTDQDPTHLARDNTGGRRVGSLSSPMPPHHQGSREADPVAMQQVARRQEEEDDRQGREERRRIFGLPQTPEGAAESVSPALGPKAKAKAATRAQSQLEGETVSLGQVVEQGVHAVSSLFGRHHEEHPAAQQAREALAAKVAGNPGKEGAPRDPSGSDVAAKLQAAGGEAGKAATEAAHAIGRGKQEGGGRSPTGEPGSAAEGRRGEAPAAERPEGGDLRAHGGGVAGALEGAAARVGHAIGWVIGGTERVAGGASREAREVTEDAKQRGEELAKLAEAAGRSTADKAAETAGLTAGRTARAVDKTKETAKEAKEDVGRRGNELGELAKAARHSAAEGISGATDRTSEAAGRTVGQAARAVEDMRDQAEETARQWGGEAKAAGNSMRDAARERAESSRRALERAAGQATGEAGTASGVDFSAEAAEGRRGEALAAERPEGGDLRAHGGGMVGALEGAAARVGHAIGWVVGGTERVAGGASREAREAREDAEQLAKSAEAAGRSTADKATETAGRAAGRTAGAIDKTKETAKEAKEDVGRRSNELGELAEAAGHSTADKAAETAGRAAGRTARAVDKTKETAKEAKEDVGRRGNELGELAESAGRSTVDKAAETAGLTAGRTAHAIDKTKETAKEAKEDVGRRGNELGELAEAAGHSAAEGISGAADRASEAAGHTVGRAARAVEDRYDQAEEMVRQWGGEADAAGNSMRDTAREGADRAGRVLERVTGEATGKAGAASGVGADFAADAVGEVAGAHRAASRSGAQTARKAMEETREEVSSAAGAAEETAARGYDDGRHHTHHQEADQGTPHEGSSHPSGLMGGLVSALGAMLGPLEREAAFDGAGVVTRSDVAGTTESEWEREPDLRKSSTDKDAGSVEAAGVRDLTEAPAGEEVEGESGAQAALDSAAGALAGKAVGAAQEGAAKASEKLGTFHWEEPVAPAELYTNTEDLLAMRAAAAQARGAGEEEE